ncbi:MAG: oleate hydratase [Bacteroidales bacterium]
MNAKKQVWIVGSGLAALATALRLAKRGYQVDILEKNTTPGGRLNQIKKNGFTFDTGPSFFSMSYEFKEFANDCGIELPFRFHPVDPLYTVHFEDNDQPFELHRNLAKLASQFQKYEPDFDQKMSRYLRDTGSLFHDTMDIVVRQNFDSLPDYIEKLSHVDKKHLPTLIANFQHVVSRYFKSEEARQILSLVAYFLGNPPNQTNGVYSLLSYTEFMHDGYHYVEGGMYEIVKGLVRELEKAGVNIHYNHQVTDVVKNGNKITAVVDQNGNHFEGDIFVVNSDSALFRGEVLKRKEFSSKKLARKEWSMGMFTMYVGLNCKIDNIGLHSYYIGKDPKKNKMDRFDHPVIPEHPYYYVNAASRFNPQSAPEGCEALMFVVPVPNLLHKKEWNDKEAIADHLLEDFSKRLGVEIMPHVTTRIIYSPENWRDNFNLYMGAALGLSHTMKQTGALRPANKDEMFINLFYTGSSTVPGIGLPMTIISSRLTTERIIGEPITPVYR